MRIRLATRQTIWGGGEELLVRLALELRGRGHDVVIAVPEHAAMRSRANGVSVAGYARPGRADLIIANDFRSLWVQSALCPGARRVFIVHGWWQTSALRNLAVRVLNASVVAVSTAVRDAILANGWLQAQTIRVAPFGPDHTRFSPRTDAERDAARAQLGIPAGAFCTAFVGRLQDVKRPELFLSASTQVGATPIFVVPDTAASAAEERTLKQLEEAWREGTALRVGSSDVQLALRACDVFVSTSQFESLGVALMEAMATGLPVVTTAVGGPADFITSGVNGFICADDELSATLVGLRDDAARRKALGAAAREAVTARTWARAADVVVA